jgi:hypothetical protein
MARDPNPLSSAVSPIASDPNHTRMRRWSIHFHPRFGRSYLDKRRRRTSQKKDSDSTDDD